MKKIMKFSKSHYDYLKKYRTKKVLILVSQISILVILLLAWELLTKYEIISSFFFSSPSRIADADPREEMVYLIPDDIKEI